MLHAHLPGVIPFLHALHCQLATVPGLLQKNILSELASTEVPFTYPKLPMYLIWHLRHQNDAAHQWLRRQVEEISKGIMDKETPAIDG